MLWKYVVGQSSETKYALLVWDTYTLVVFMP